MNKINCLILDDEELARLLLENYTQKLPFLHLVGKCKNAVEAMEVMNHEQVDLLFLDIQMPEITGVSFLKSLPRKPLTIFTTAYSEYAIQGYDLDVVDYLLKPIGFERFVQAVNKASDRFAQQKGSANNKETEQGFILIRADHKIHRLAYDEILYIQSMREYAAFYTRNGRILALKSLKSLEEELPSERFIRIHKSYMVSASAIKTINGNVLLVGEEELPVGNLYRDEIMRRFFT